MCESLFPCQTSVEDIKNEALFVTTSSNNDASLHSTSLFSTLFAPTLTTDRFNPSEERREGRSTCKISGALCPGITIGCALCGVFAPGTCGDTCIIAGLYCGTSGYACQYEASLNEEDENGNEDGNGEVTTVATPDETTETEAAVEGGPEEGGTPRKNGSRPRFFPFRY